MNEIKIFTSPQFGDIRTAGTAEQPLFCANDVAKALGYSNPAKSVIDHCKKEGVTVLETPTPNQHGAVVNQPTKFITEANLYRLVMRSKLPNAEEFQDWVCGEVLPSIRKHGAYMTGETILKAMQDPANLVQLLQALKDEQDKRRELQAKTEEQTATIEHQQQAIGQLENAVAKMKDKVSYYDQILASKNTVTMTQIAQDYGMSAKRLNQTLYDMRIQHKVGKQWILYAPYLTEGYVHSEAIPQLNTNGTAFTVNLTKWTQRGRLFLYHKLKDKNIIPLIEK